MDWIVCNIIMLLWLWFVVGGFVIGVLVIFFLGILGVGYEVMDVVFK